MLRCERSGNFSDLLIEGTVPWSEAARSLTDLRQCQMNAVNLLSKDGPEAKPSDHGHTQGLASELLTVRAVHSMYVC